MKRNDKRVPLADTLVEDHAKAMEHLTRTFVNAGAAKMALRQAQEILEKILFIFEDGKTIDPDSLLHSAVIDWLKVWTDWEP